jgi:cytidine deaminase
MRNAKPPNRPPADGVSGLAGAAPLTAEDEALVEAARAVLARHYKPVWHMVAAALRSRDGRIWTGLHLGATVGRMQVCAEVTALGRAILEGDGSIECMVAVRHPKAEEAVRDIAVVPPCGACREMLTDFDAGAHVIVPAGGGTLLRVPVRSLLPLPYQR